MLTTFKQLGQYFVINKELHILLSLTPDSFPGEEETTRGAALAGTAAAAAVA